jgi:ketosteroid isomerase-like protein
VASANVELVRSIYAAWERGDFSSAEWADPEIEIVWGDGPSESTSWSGLAGMASAWREFLSTWRDWRVQAEEYREIDDVRLLVLFQASGTGKASRMELGQIQARGANVFHIKDDKVTKLVNYLQREHAFADLGLTPEAD